MSTLEKIRAELKRRYWKTNQGKPSNRNGYNNAIDDALQIIDKYADQEPCTDSVSRQAVLDVIDDEWICNADYDFRSLAESIEQLPSVRPQEQTGEWILLDECANSGYYCSECQKKLVKEGWSKTVKKIKFCPNCGARMVEQTCDTCKYNTAAFNPCNACDNKSLFEPQESEEV